MALSQLLNRDCTIIRSSASVSTDELGNAVNVETTTDTVCEVQQRSRDEVAGAEWSEAQWLGVFLSGTVLDTGDQVEVDDLGVFEVAGQPWAIRNPRTQVESHVEATLRLVAGAGDAS